MKYRLAFLNGKYKGKRFVVGEGTVTIGRYSDCQIDLDDDDEVSRRHAVLETRGDGVYVRDLGALNRIRVNGRDVNEARLSHGDTVELGRTQFQYLEPYTAAAYLKRRRSLMQHFALGLAGAVLVAEVIYLIFNFAWWRHEMRPERLAQWAGPITQPAPAPEPTAEPALADVDFSMPVMPGAEPPAPAEAGTPAVKAPAVAPVATVPAPIPETMVAAVAESTPVAPSEEAPVAAPSAPPAAGITSDDTTAGLKPAAPETPKEPDVQLAEIAEPETPVEERAPPPPIVETAPPLQAAAPSAPPPSEIPPPIEVASRTEPPVVDYVETRARAMLDTALREIAAHNLEKADQELARIQIMAPDFLPAYVERASLYERRGLLEKAAEQWSEVLRRSVGSPLYEEAAAERLRLARQIQALTAKRQQVERRAPGVVGLPRRIRIVSVDREKFQTSNEYEEMRLLRLELRPKTTERSVDTSDVKVEVTFFDRELETGRIRPTRVVVPEGPLQVEGVWEGGEERIVTAAYIVPMGFRVDEEDEYGEQMSYYGYVVRIYYHGELQDEEARPDTLRAELSKLSSIGSRSIIPAP